MSKPIFQPPAGLVEVSHLILPRVQTWGSSNDRAYRELAVARADIPRGTVDRFDWFVFCIRCTVGQSRSKWKRQVPDVENIPKLIVDAFTGTLYDDDNLHHVRAVQVEAEWGPDEEEKAEVWIYGCPKEEAQA